MSQELKPAKKPSESAAPAKKPLRAKKAFLIQQNEYSRKISVGEDLSDVPAKYHQNLKTEGVID
jgi:hypothetical protein